MGENELFPLEKRIEKEQGDMYYEYIKRTLI